MSEGKFISQDNSERVNHDLLPVGVAAFLPYWSPAQISAEGIPTAGIGPGDLLFSKSSCGRFLSVNYNQFSAAAFKHRLLKQARGLIVGSRCGTEIDLNKPILKPIVFARPFDRFLNWEPGDDLTGGTVYEKADGTLGILWYDPFKKAWALATRSSVHADIPGEGGKTFRQLFEECLSAGHHLTFDELTKDLNPMWTYLFEICHSDADTVVVHEKSHLQFIGARHLLTGQICLSDTFQEMPIPAVKRWEFKTQEEIISFVESRPGQEAEGVVVVCEDKWYKLKSESYRAAHRITSERLTSRKLYSLVLSGKVDEIYSQLSDSKKALCDTTMKSVTAAVLALGNLYASCEKRLASQLTTADLTERQLKKERAAIYLENGSRQAAFLFEINKAGGNIESWISASYNNKKLTFVDSFIEYAESLK